VSGIETVQILKYAARTVQLARFVAGVDLEPEIVEALAAAPSNVAEYRDGRVVWERLVKPSVVSLDGVAAHVVISAAVRHAPEEGRVYCYRYRLRGREEAQVGPAALALARVEIESLITGRRVDLAACVLHFGAADFRCGLVPWPGEDGWEGLRVSLLQRVERRSLAEVLRAVDRVFPGREYSLRDLFLDERRRVAEALLLDRTRRHEHRYLEMFEDDERLMEFLREIDSPIPGPLRVAADVTLTRRLLEVTAEAAAGRIPLREAEAVLGAAVQQARRLGAHLHLLPVRLQVEGIVRGRLAALLDGGGGEAEAREVVEILELAHRLGLGLDLWDAQNRVWDWAAGGPLGIERDAAEALARALWFDPQPFLARAGYPAIAPAA
jgi:hypothetical protein